MSDEIRQFNEVFQVIKNRPNSLFSQPNSTIRFVFSGLLVLAVAILFLKNKEDGIEEERKSLKDNFIENIKNALIKPFGIMPDSGNDYSRVMKNGLRTEPLGVNPNSGGKITYFYEDPEKFKLYDSKEENYYGPDNVDERHELYNIMLIITQKRTK